MQCSPKGRPDEAVATVQVDNITLPERYRRNNDQTALFVRTLLSRPMLQHWHASGYDNLHSAVSLFNHLCLASCDCLKHMSAVPRILDMSHDHPDAIAAMTVVH